MPNIDKDCTMVADDFKAGEVNKKKDWRGVKGQYYDCGFQAGQKELAENVMKIFDNWMKDLEWDNWDYKQTGNEEDKDFLGTALYKRDFEELKKEISKLINRQGEESNGN